MRCVQLPSLCFHALKACDFVTRVDLLNSVTYLNGTYVFKWCAVRCGSKNRCQKELGLVSLKRDVHSKFNRKHNGVGAYMTI